MDPVRPTIRCLREDLRLALPPITVLLDEVDHPLLSKAREQFSEPDVAHERIVAIDDAILFKAKIQRWRGAVWVDDPLPWLVAGGKQEAGSPDDFYAALAADGQANRALQRRQ